MAGLDGIDMKTRNLKWWALLLSPSIFILLVIVIPFLYAANFSGISNFSIFFGNGTAAALSRQAFRNSIYQGFASAVMSLAIGFPLGIFIGRYRTSHRRALKSFIIIPFFMPSVIIVLAFASLFGKTSPLIALFPFVQIFSYGFSGIIAINTFFNAPLVAFLASTGIERSHKTLEEASSILGSGRFGTFINIWGRDGLTGAISGTILAFLYSFSGFAAPLIIGGPSNFTIETWIYFLVRQEGLVQVGVLFGLLQSLFLLIPLVIYLFLMSMHRFVDEQGSDRNEEIPPKREIWFILGSLYTSIFLIFEVMVFASIAISSVDIGWNSHLTLNGYSELFGRASSSLDIPSYLPFLNTAFYGIVTAITVCLIGVMWVVGKRRLNMRNDSARDFVQYVPLVIPAIMMALSISVFYETIIDPAYLWLLIIAVQSAVAIPVVLRVVSGGFSEIPKSYTDSARVMGGNALFEVELPLAGSSIATALMFGFAISMGEFTATNFLSTNTFMPLSVEVYSLESLRLASASYAAAAILLALSFMFFFAIQKAGDRFIGIR